jgi:hypothetical protein
MVRVGTGKQLMGGGGHRGLIGVEISDKDLKQITKDLDNLFPSSDTQLRNALRGAMRKAAKPAQTYLKALIPSRGTGEKRFGKGQKVNPAYRGKQGGRPGQLKRSIQIINGKTKGGRFPSVYVGPRVKGGNWANVDKTGFYFFFWEYGHFNPITKSYHGPKRWLDQTAQATGPQVLGRLVGDIKQMIDKRWAKKLG